MSNQFNNPLAFDENHQIVGVFVLILKFVLFIVYFSFIRFIHKNDITITFTRPSRYFFMHIKWSDLVA